MATHKQEKISEQDFREAVAIYSGINPGLSKEEQEKINSLLNHNLSLQEFLLGMNVVMMPTMRQVNTMEKNWLIAQEVMDKLGATKEDWDNATKDVEEANKKAYEQLQEQIKEADKEDDQVKESRLK